MMDKNKQLIAKFSNIHKFNSQFSKCSVAIAYHGDNRNFSSISKEVFEKMIPSLYGIPVVGEWKVTEDDYGSHGGKIEISDEGINYVETTKPFGFVGQDADVYWETITEEDGQEHEYLVASPIYLWTSRYPEAEKVLEGQNNQSMEIQVISGEARDDGYFDITDAEFSALCIFGSEVEPAFESSSFKQFNLDKETFKAEFNLMVKELKQSAFEGGENVTKSPIEEIKDEVFEEEVVEEVVEITEETTDETVEEVATEEETTEEVTEVTETDVVAEEKFTKMFELSHDDIRSKLYTLLYKVEEDDDDYYYIQKVYDNYFIYGGWDDDSCYKQGYITTDVDVAFEGERVEMFIEYLTADELEELNNMRNNYSLVLSENEELKSFKANTLSQQKSDEVEDVFNKYATLLDLVDYEDLQENAVNMDIETLEKELSFRLVQKKFDFSKIIKKDSTKITIKEDKDAKEPYGSASVYFNKQ